MEKDTLYEGERVKITYLHSPEPGEESKVISGEEHELWMKSKRGDWGRFILQRGILQELVKQEDVTKLIRKLDTINSSIIYHADFEGITVNEILGALRLAYLKEEMDFQNYMRAQSNR